MQFEVVIVGAGPAAFSAATFLARANIKTLIIGDPAGSGLADAAQVQNYAGFAKGIAGTELLEQMREQAVQHGAIFMKGEVVHVEQMANSKSQIVKFKVKTADTKEIIAERLLLAHGANFIKVNLPGEKELVGKGVHYCALCDGPLYKGKQVIVLGNGNYAAEEALQLAAMGAQVEITTHAIEPNFAKPYQELLEKNKISAVVGKAERFNQEGSQVSISVRQSSFLSTQKRDAVFIALGVASSMTFAQKLGLEINGNFLRADKNGRTNVAGVWVAGLARGGVNQIAKSVGEGAVAAVDIIKVVTGLPQYLDHT